MAAVTVVGAHHTGFSVSSLDRSLAFYVDLLGCEVLWRREITPRWFQEIVGVPDCLVKRAQLRIPGSGHVLELLEYATPRGTAVDSAPNNPGVPHLCLLVDDLVAAHRELQARGVRFRSRPVPITDGAGAGGQALYLLDPDGIIVELYQPPRPA